MCSLRFDIEENTIIEAFVRFRFASVAITSYHSHTALLEPLMCGAQVPTPVGEKGQNFRY
jgi:hypothetical protein